MNPTDPLLAASTPAGPAICGRLVDLEGIQLEVLADRHDVAWYQQRKTFEEKASLLYRFIHAEGFAQFVDVGANVGLISILASRAAPHMKCVAIEADPRLVVLMRRNMKRQNLDQVEVINAIVGAEERSEATFCLNPNGSLDNRVHVDGWRQVRVPMVSLGKILERGIGGKTFIKIDTQGFELNVLRGGEAWLRRHNEWVIKMEFAPFCLQSQGTEPLALLAYLQRECRYELAECAERITFGTPNFNALFAHPLKVDEHAAFLQHVISLNSAGRGWVDLLLRPRAGC
jgi:FkbM family methyltransferase